DGLRGLGRALETVSALSLMCDPRDLGQSLGEGQLSEHGAPAERAPGTAGFDPTIFLFDAHPGGVGLAPRIFERARELFERAHLLIDSCPCSSGCPACVGPVQESAVTKRIALDILCEIGIGIG